MKAAIYARYSSENQRPESIEDQLGACRRLARERNVAVLDDHIYSDKARSGARKDRPGLEALLAAAPRGEFDVVLVDDLSRLARDNHLMLSVIAELHFEGIRVISVADGLDSDDEEATLGIQVRGIFNELQLRDLKKKTLRGQMGQKERGFFVGERTFGYRSVPVGEMRMDKKGRPRPEGYKMEIEPREAAIVLRIFKAYADGHSLTAIARSLNLEHVPGQIRSAKGWSTSTISRILDNEKYAGRWIWKSHREPTRSADRPAQAIREARVGVDRPRGREPAGRPERSLASGAQAPAGDAPHLARWRRHARILRRAAELRATLPHPPALERNGVRPVRRDDRLGERQGQRLLRVPAGGAGWLREQAARSPQARRDDHPRRRS